MITSAWDIQEDYNPGFQGNEEWTLGKREDLSQTMPDLNSMFERTIPKVMVAPSTETLEGFKQPNDSSGGSGGSTGGGSTAGGDASSGDTSEPDSDEGTDDGSNEGS